jgi:hypothetical protein
MDFVRLISSLGSGLYAPRHSQILPRPAPVILRGAGFACRRGSTSQASHNYSQHNKRLKESSHENP